MTRDSLRGNLGMVLQETWLRAGTVRENIAYGKPDATREEIIEAARLAGAERFIMALKDGFNTYVASAVSSSRAVRSSASPLPGCS